MWQTIVAGLIVLVAFLYAAWALMPAALRLRMARALAGGCQRPGCPGWLGRAGTALENAALKRMGGCSDCSAVQDAPHAPRRRRDS